MSKDEIIAEIPKLSRKDRREIVRRIMEVEEDAAVLADCDQRALEQFQMLDRMEAEVSLTPGFSRVKKAQTI